MDNSIYLHPLHLSGVLADKMEGYLFGVASKFQEKFDKFLEFGISPLMRNEMYPFYIVDYGFLMYVLISWIKDTGAIKLATEIENDYTKSNDNLTRNGAFFIAILEYYGVAFRQRNAKSFYVKNLFYNNERDVHFIINSIAINRSAMDKFCGYEMMNEIDSMIKKINADVVAYGASISKYFSSRKQQKSEPVKVINFWDAAGINYELFN